MTVASEEDKKAQREMLKKIGPGLWVSFRGKLKEVLARKRVNRVLSANKSWCNTTCPGVRNKEKQMEALFFFVIWLGGAVLHTLFDLRIKPVLQSVREESDLP